MEHGSIAGMGNETNQTVNTSVAVRELVIVEAAIEGADMGDQSLKDALSCKLLEVISLLEGASRN